MATQNVVPVIPKTVTIEQQVLTDLHNGLHRIIFAHIGILILLFTLMGVGGYFGLKSYDRALAHAETLQAQFNVAQATAAAAQKQLTDLLAADAAQRAAESAQQASLTQQILKRDTLAPAPVVQTALAPSANAASVALGLQSLYAGSNPPVAPKAVQDGNIEISAPEGQLWVADKLALNRFSADYQDEVKLYTLEQAKTNSLQTDLTACQSTVSKDEAALVDAKKALTAYDKLAHRSKLRKILGGIGRNAERVGIAVAAFELGHRL